MISMFHFFRSVFCKIAPILIGCLFLATSAICAEYYVSPSGDDEDGAGSISEPWGTIDYAAARLSPGDTLFARGGVYNETVNIQVSGSAAEGWITLAAYPEETPEIDGAGLAVQWETGLFYLEDISYVKIAGFELRNLSTGNANYTPAGIWVLGSSHHIEISDNLVHHIETTHDEGNAHGIAVYGTTATESIHDISIAGNEIRNCAIVHNTLYQNDSVKHGNGELTLQYDVSGLIIENNIFVANDQNLFISNPYEKNVGSTVDFNVYYGPGGPDDGQWQWQDQAYCEFSAWKSATGNDANSVFGDPLLILPASGDLHIASDSPARNAGDDLDADVRGLLDIDGDDRAGDGAADIGADETVSAKTIFVSGADPSCGQNEPCRSTLGAGIDLCDPDRSNIVKVEQGTYPEDVVVVSSCQIFLRCGYDPDFASNPATSSARTVSVRRASITVENLVLEPVKNPASR